MVAEDPATACLTYSALAGWCLGKADWSDRQQEAIERARSLEHPFTTVWTMTNLSIAHLARHEWEELGMFVDEGQKLADKCGLISGRCLWICIGTRQWRRGVRLKVSRKPVECWHNVKPWACRCSYLWLIRLLQSSLVKWG